MTTIEEQSGTLGELLDDWAEGLLAFSEWSDADPEIDNSGTDDQGESTNDWRSNGRVLEHGPSGSYFLLHLVTYEQSYNVGDGNLDSVTGRNFIGARLIHSTDWDTGNHSPAGKTTVTGSDQMYSEVENYQNHSYERHSSGSGTDEATGLPVYDRDDDEYEFIRNRPVVYFGSVNSDGFAFGAWGTNSDDDIASWMHFEHVDEKFWDDGVLPTILGFGESAYDPGSKVAYGFETSYGYRFSDGATDSDLQAIFGYQGEAAAVEDAEWGFVNPNADDDTFFFRRPVFYSSQSRNYPSGFIYDVIPNHITEGGAHGDIITHDGTDYRVFRRSGQGTDNTTSVGLRYE